MLSLYSSYRKWCRSNPIFHCAFLLFSRFLFRININGCLIWSRIPCCTLQITPSLPLDIPQSQSLEYNEAQFCCSIEIFLIERHQAIRPVPLPAAQNGASIFCFDANHKISAIHPYDIVCITAYGTHNFWGIKAFLIFYPVLFYFAPFQQGFYFYWNHIIVSTSCKYFTIFLNCHH